VASGSYSGPTRVTAPIFQKAGIPMVAGYAVHPDVTWDPKGDRNQQNRGKSSDDAISWDQAMDIVAKGQQRATIWNIPNLLTSFRIFSIPLIVLLLTSPGPLPSFLAALVFTIAAITDLLDGYFARLQRGDGGG
jgi:hypothetical protein